LALPLLAGSYFIVNPLKARSMPLTHQQEAPLPSRQDLKEFEGYYLADFDRDTYIQIKAKGNQLILKQLWDNKEVVFNQQSPLEFLDVDKGFPLKFSKNDKGEVVQVLAFNKDHWNKVKNYSPPKFVHLQPGELKSFEGYYQMEAHGGNMNYIQIESIPEALILRQGWDGREILFSPKSATEFSDQYGAFPLEFTKDNNGNVTQLMAFHRDVWKKMQDPSTAVIKKQVELEPSQLKAVEGEYQVQGGNKISIKAEREGILIKQLWNNEAFHLVPSSATEFFSKEKGMPIAFKTDKDGMATELIAFGKATWTKVK
jgi:uncharacterized protein YjhX (UPF0386 family)